MAGTSRESFLKAVRTATSIDVPPYTHAAEPVEGEVGRLADTSDLPGTYAERASGAGIAVHRVANAADAARSIGEIVREAGVKTVSIPATGIVETLPLDKTFPESVSILKWDMSAAQDDKKSAAFAMECGITGVDYAIAETGSFVLVSRPECPRSLSLLGDVHIAVVEASQIIPDLYDLYVRLNADHPDGVPSNVNIITGPSKTADIELTIVVGVHGPRAVHVVLIG